MIAFNKNFDEDENDLSKSLNKLQDLLSSIFSDEDLEINDENNSFEDSNISDLIETVYFHLFTENYSEMDISIKKNLNNSLNINIKKLK